MPRRALNIAECEIARAYKVHGNSIEPVAFIVPRKADSFQSDIYPPAPSIEASLSASEFFAGKNVTRRLVDLSNGATFSESASSANSPPPASATSVRPPSPIALTKSFSASSPTPAAAPAPIQAATVAPTVIQEPSPLSPAAPKPIESSLSPVQSQAHGDNDTVALKDENARLNRELRDAREKIRNLELQVESMRANARKAAEALLGA